ncbi:MAG: nucleotidyl transferase AbiEii/AbiGii toxin family protein [bacterium]
MTDFKALLEALAAAGVEFILVGGLAGIAHGSARLTQDIDIVYARRDENLEKLAEALTKHHPYLRGAPPGLPFKWDATTLRHGLNFTLETTLGDIDLLGEITGGGLYEDLLPHTLELRLFNCLTLCLDLDKLIETKRAAGRPKDLEAIAELEALRETRSKD